MENTVKYMAYRFYEAIPVMSVKHESIGKTIKQYAKPTL